MGRSRSSISSWSPASSPRPTAARGDLQLLKLMPRFERVLLRNVGIPDIRKLDVYRARGGYDAAKKVLTEWTPDQTVEIIKSSGLRGRGGAGFPCGMKWSFLPPERTITYLCVNADESEPGTLCNRVLMEE